MSIIARRIFLFSLLLLFLYSTSGYYLVFEVMKSHVRKEMQARMRNSRSPHVRLELNTAGNGREYYRTNKDEIRYQDKMYDVIKEVRVGEKTIFYCLHDRKEESLVATMKSLGSNRILQLLWEQVIKIAYPHFTAPAPPVTNSEISYPSICLIFISASIFLETPPPKTV